MRPVSIATFVLVIAGSACRAVPEAAGPWLDAEFKAGKLMELAN